MPTPSYREELISQIPALQLLMAMGWQYLTPVEALALRGGKKSAVVLTGVLEPWLAEHNGIAHKGQRYAFSEGNIREALRRLTDLPPIGLLPLNEDIYELLTLGISLPQTIGGDTRSYSLHYIDWANSRNNVYHVADEFVVERSGGVIWHTTGTGKSITMVMLAKALTIFPAIRNPRVVIVTDRVDLDTQIWGTFKKCGKSVAKAASGRQLIDLIRSGKADVIATVINKFETVAGEKLTDDNINIFVLVDESHRSQYRLKVIEDANEGIKLSRGYLYVQGEIRVRPSG